MKKTMALLIAAFVVVVNVWSATVTNVRGQQRQNSNIVDVYYDLNASDGGTYTVDVAFQGKSETMPGKSLTGAVGGGVAPGKNRHVVWDAGADWAGKKGQLKAVVTATKEEKSTGQVKKVQLWEGGPYWADRNIGAQSPWDYGYYFWWGDTTGYYSSDFYLDWWDYGPSSKSIATLQSEGWIVSKDGTYVLVPAHDAAHVHCGGSWRMPTKQEFDDLNSKCDWTWTTMNGVNGYIVRGQGDYASNSIFLPCAGGSTSGSLTYSSGSYGNYWSSVPHSSSGSWGAYILIFDSSSHRTSFFNHRHRGQSVRPVQEFTK